MKFPIEIRKRVLARTSSRCHVCRKALVFESYGQLRTPTAWEIDHSVPRARGGTDRMNNLLPACIPCNRSKQDGSSRSARSRHGHLRRPMSASEQDNARIQNGAKAAIGGAGLGMLVAGPPGALVGWFAGALGGLLTDPD